MKTTDGAELVKGKFYYLLNGQQVYLNNCATTPEGNTVFLVVPLYEGETMTVSGNGGMHCEYTADYEHEGDETMVESLFEKSPVEKLDPIYKAKLKDIESLSLAAGILKDDCNKMKININQLEREIKEAYKQHKIISKQISDTKDVLVKTQDDVNVKKMQLSVLEDSMANYTDKSDTTVIDKKELQRLNKRDFELQCLESGGVDNWEWYSESLKDYIERYPED